MTIARLLTQSVTVRHYQEGSRDELNNAIEDWDDGDEYSAYLEQRPIQRELEGAELLDGRDTRISDFLLVLPKTAEIGPLDRVIDSDDRTYAVVGDPQSVWNPRRAEVSHIEAVLRRIEGAGEPDENS